LFVDVDHFKLFNDQHGHQSGDECLRAVAGVVGEHAGRPADLAARYGGEEFAVIMPETDRDGACAIAERMRKAVLALRIAHGGAGAGPMVTLSIGVATHVPGDNCSPELLLGEADQAVYAAKALGRNRVTSADSMLADFARMNRDKMAPRSRVRARRR
jgi:diguanylate cyclase (GGDEF)-like protein